MSDQEKRQHERGTRCPRCGCNEIRYKVHDPKNAGCWQDGHCTCELCDEYCMIVSKEQANDTDKSCPTTRTTEGR
jgi:hypothetical protein